jgi:D-glycero-D-manno-heptose 1,7-bisphosphate phosphatase
VRDCELGRTEPERLVILDRDGVINQDSPAAIRSPEEWVPIPGSLEAIARLHRGGYRVVVATNQSGIGHGLLSLDTLRRIHALMLAEVERRGGRIAGVFFCPHRPEDGCGCRKPAPGLLHDVARTLGVGLAGAYVVGDSERDVLAARRVSAAPVLVRSGNGRRTLATSAAIDGVPVFDDLASFAATLLEDHDAPDETRGD